MYKRNMSCISTVNMTIQPVGRYNICYKLKVLNDSPDKIKIGNEFELKFNIDVENQVMNLDGWKVKISKYKCTKLSGTNGKFSTNSQSTTQSYGWSMKPQNQE